MDIYGIILPIDVHIFSSWLLHHQPVYIYNIYIYYILEAILSSSSPKKRPLARPELPSQEPGGPWMPWMPWMPWIQRWRKKDGWFVHVYPLVN